VLEQASLCQRESSAERISETRTIIVLIKPLSNQAELHFAHMVYQQVLCTDHIQTKFTCTCFKQECSSVCTKYTVQVFILSSEAKFELWQKNPLCIHIRDQIYWGKK
jgi:hypothetical protein